MKSTEILVTLLKCMTTIKIIPHKWNLKTKRLRALDGFQLIPTYILTLPCWIRTTFLIFNFFHSMSKMTLFIKFLHGLWTGVLIGISLLGMTNIYTRFEFANAVNNFFRTQKRFEDESRKDNPNYKEGRMYQHFLQVIPLLLILLSVFFAFLFLQISDQPWYFNSVFEFSSPESNSWLLYLFSLVEFIEFILLCNISIFSILFLICYWYSMTIWLVYLSSPKFINEERNLKQFGSSIEHYRSLQVLNQQYRQVYSPFYLPILQLAIILLPIIQFHILIRYYSLIPYFFVLILIMSSLYAISFLLIMYPLAAKINTASAGYLKSLQVFPHSPLITKSIKSCKPLQIQIQQYFYINRFSSCRLISIVIFWTFRSLLLIKN